MNHQPQPNAALRARAEHAAKYGAQLVVPAVDVKTALERIEHAEARASAMRELHAPRDEQVIDGDCAAEECDHEDGCPTRSFTVCTECYRMVEESNRYFGEDGVSSVAYPCPTIRALDGAP